MKTKKIRWMRSISALLFSSMLLGLTPFVPQFSMVQKAEAADGLTGNYISMPITIRDYAADGMLFEFNQVNATGTTGGTTTESININAFNPSYDTWLSYCNNRENGVYICTYSGMTTTGPWGAGLNHLMIICNSDGTIQEVVPKGTRKGTCSETKAKMSSTDYVIWCSNAAAEYSTLSVITADNMGNYSLKYDGNTLTVTNSAGGAVYHQADTAGFSMLATTAADHINNLTDSSSIPGTELIQNGTWGLKTDPDPVEQTLFEDEDGNKAIQNVYGAWVRTGLVENELDENGKPVYTEAAVTYLAEYMEEIMAVPEKNADGSYNTYFVTGVELNELGGNTLAEKIRNQVTKGLGTYASAKGKFDDGELSEYTGIDTWYDAAYFLLHNVFYDNVGYGKTAKVKNDDNKEVEAYRNIHLIETQNDAGETCYVFNSKYDDTEYDYANGEIYNTQTDTFTIAKTNSGTETYVRGNPLPEPRFDPLGPSGAGVELGYGMSGDTYGDMISPSTAEWNTFYDNTNYHLSLEGHAQFIYYEDSNLYFTFTGDDDVYLFINGKRVLDVGAAHSISKVKINLNDVAELCGLKDGQAYDFDFFYMERHGTAANFGIETNIRIVDPAMTTTKEGFQNGISTGYNGYVHPLVPVVYQFGLENKGEADIQELTFTDEDIGVELTKDSITLNDETDIAELSVTVYNASGTVKESIAAGSLTEAKLMELLKAGLAVNQKIVIYGFEYTIPTEKWVDNVFPNVVYTTAVSIGDNNSTQNLNGMADWKVQEREYKVQGYHVYEWMGESVTLYKEELLKPLENINGFDPYYAKIELCNATGATSGTNVNKNARLNDNDSITYTGTKTGEDTFYYKVTENAVNVVIGVAVYSYDVADNTYVLDYGLAVELNGEEFGLMVNDTLSLADNPHKTAAKVTGIEKPTSNYGEFAWNDPSLKYTPNDIIDNTDTVQVNVQVLEDGADEVTKFTGVDMYETVTTAPANVVYYEENFPGITYVNTVTENGEVLNEWVHYETVKNGVTVAGTVQSADQDSNYGSDPNYKEDKVGEITEIGDVGTTKDEIIEVDESDVVESTGFVLDTSDLDALQASGIEALNEYLGLGGSDSNGTVNELVVKKTAEVMYFDFVGTGFEILSRTTDEEYAVINVQVQRKNTDGTYTVVKQKPVITESKGGDLYQVPIISITGLEKDEYRVVVKAAGSTETKTRVLYIDGIRIYGPLNDNEALEYYNPEEYQAKFFEIKQLINTGKIIYADASETDDDLQLVTGSTLIESNYYKTDFDEDDNEFYVKDENGNYVIDPEKTRLDSVLTSVESVDVYMELGPNNEIYLDGNYATGMIAFFLTPAENYPEGARTLEIGAHRKSDSILGDNGYVRMTYGSTAQDIIDGTNKYEISSGTEMYYTIDVENLDLGENGKYLVMIGTNDSENLSETLALTNIKVAGYEISFAEADLQTAAENDTLASEPVVQEVGAVFAARRLSMPEDEEETEEIPVNENLSIVSASFKAAKVVSGKVATLNVRTSAEADRIEIIDADGNILEAFERMNVSTKSNGELVFTAIWKVYGSRGDVLNYTVRAYDAEGCVSVNEETLSVTIK